MLASDTLTIRLYQSGDQAALNALYNEVFGADRGLDIWRWKYDQGPRAQIKLTTVLEDAGQIVGQYSGLTLDMIYRNQTVIGTQPMDIAIRDAYRGSQLSIPLFEAWKSGVRAARVVLAFGFPNPVHYKVGKNVLSYPDVGPVMLLRYYLNPGLALYKLAGQPIALTRQIAGWLRLRRGPRRPTGLVFERLDHFDQRFDDFWAQMAHAYPIMVARTRAYLNWRYVARPDVSYTIYAACRDDAVQGYVVLALQHRRVAQGIIADVLAVDESTTQALLDHALAHFHAVGADVVSAWALPESDLYAALCRSGLTARRVAVPLVGMAFDREAIDEAFLCDPRNWYVTMGDSDGV